MLSSFISISRYYFSLPILNTLRSYFLSGTEAPFTLCRKIMWFPCSSFFQTQIEIERWLFHFQISSAYCGRKTFFPVKPPFSNSSVLAWAGPEVSLSRGNARKTRFPLACLYEPRLLAFFVFVFCFHVTIRMWCVANCMWDCKTAGMRYFDYICFTSTSWEKDVMK